MFDNPKKHLRRMEEELRALEPEAEEPEEAGEVSDPENWTPEMGPGKNTAVDFGRMVYADEYTREDAVLPAEKKNRKKPKASQKEPKKRRKKSKPFGWQLLLALAEIGLIIVIVRWWLEWIT